MEHRFPASIQRRDEAEPFPGAGGDVLSLRVDGDDGPCPVAIVEGVSTDRVWAPFHSHPWDEFVYVLEGTIEFQVGEFRASAPVGGIQALPRGVPHSLRVPEGAARYLMVTMGAPSVQFLREVGEAYAGGPTLAQLVEIAARHGVTPILESSSGTHEPS